MPFIYTLKTAIIGLKTNKIRSLLTILGIVIGIASIIMIMSLGKGAHEMIMGQLSGWGSLTVSLEPGGKPKGLSDMAEIYTDSVRERDLAAIKKKSNVSNIKNIIPFVMANETLLNGGERYRGSIAGATGEYMNFFNIYPEEGVLFSENEIKSNAKVIVIGWEVKDELFGASDAVGEKVKIKNQWFRIMGVFPKSGTVGMQNIDKMVLMPYTSAQEYITGTKYFQAIIMQATEERYLKQVVRDLEATVREMHNITDPDKDDFHVGTMDQAASMIGNVTGALTLFLGSVAAISLVVGGIGIMNIMLVSVTERTSEIGLRKALGATSRNILIQFLCESIILTGLGGFLGVLIGAGLSLVISQAILQFTTFKWVFVFPVEGAVLGVVVATVTGVIFGIYPAKKASSKSPMEALRYE